MTSPQAREAPIFQAEGIHKSFGDVDALSGVDLEIRPGEWLGLLGPNGAGKTTLMHILSGILAADKGSIRLMGKAIEAGRPWNPFPHIGIIPQEVALYPHLSALENLRAFGSFHGLVKDRLKERIEWSLVWTGLADRQHHRTATFSGGMKRRLNIACGILHEPELVLLDEPTVGVDPHARQRIWDMLGDLRDSGTSLIHSSHQLQEIERTCDRVLIIDHGKKIGDGAVSELLNSHRQQDRNVTLRFSENPAPELFETPVEIQGPVVTTVFSNPEQDLRHLLGKLEDKDLELIEVTMEAPRLEDLFAEITGKDLRE